MRIFLLFIGLLPGPALGQEDFLLEARRHLKALVRLDTSNPPGNEILAARYLKGELDRERIPSEIYTSSPTRASLIARLKGSRAKKPLILMCHTDVVPADRREWETDPFVPVEKDGYLYGRGTADIKSMCAVELSILAWLKRRRVPLERDLIFFAEADEETGDKERHINWLLREHGEALEAEYAINEGGNTLWGAGKPLEIRIQAAEKEYLDLVLTARGQAGHSSVPRRDNPVAALSRAVARLSDYRPPAELLGVVRAFLERQAETAPQGLKAAIREVLAASPGEELDRASERLSEVQPEFGAMLRDTLSPTILKAGYKSNVIPAEAEATLNARLLPGRGAEDFAAGLLAVMGEPMVGLRYDPPLRPPIAAMPTDTPLYRAAAEAAREISPGIPVMPFMAAWSTDSQELRARGVIVYGIDPPLSEEDGERVHGANERISLEALDWYALYLRQVVLRAAAGEVKGRPEAR